MQPKSLTKIFSTNQSQKYCQQSDNHFIQNLSPKYYRNNKLSKAITNCDQLSSSNRCLVKFFSMRHKKIWSGIFKSFRSPSVQQEWSSGMSVKDTSRELNFCFPYQKNSCPCQSKENVKRQLLSPFSFLIQNDFKIDLIGLIIKIEENEIKNLLMYRLWKQLYVAAGIR